MDARVEPATLRRVLAGLRRRAVDAAARRHLPDVDLHAGAVLRQPGGERQGHGARRLTLQITELTNLLSLEKGKGKSLADELAACRRRWRRCAIRERAAVGPRRCRAATKDARISGLTTELENQKKSPNEALAKVDLLNQQLLSLRRQIAALKEALEASEKKDEESQTRI